MNKERIDEILNTIETEHNHSLYIEVRERNKNNLDSLAVYYRGTKITYRRLFDEIIPAYVKAFQKCGIGVDSEIPICVSNTPEFIFLVLAASYVGAKINVFGAEFEDSYKTEILNSCNSPFVFASDDVYPRIKQSIDNSNKTNVVMISLADSLPNGIDPYDEIDSKYYKFENKVNTYKEMDDKIVSQNEFLSLGNDVELKPPVKGSLDDIFTTTYSSGSTNSLRPKGIVHINRSYIVMGRSHDKDLSNAPSMHGLRVLAMIPTHSNTNLMSNITDTLIQGSCVIPEPIEHPDFLLNSFLINKPNFVTATRSLIIKAAKQILYSSDYKNVRLPYLFALFSVGEPTVPNEEKFINKALTKARAGKLWFDKTEKRFLGKLPVAFPVSKAGGDCEHGGIFYTMFNKWTEAKEKLVGHLSKDQSLGMSTHQIVSCVVLDENGNEVKNGQMGRLYATSPCNMHGYKDNPEATNAFFKEINGKMYGDCSALATKDDYGRINLIGRIDSKLPMEINKIVPKMQEIILKDTKNVLSCEIIPQLVDNDYVFIAHVEFQPERQANLVKSITMTEERCNSLLGPEIASKIYYRVHGFNESYPLTGCGKRNNNALIKEGITEKCFKPILNGDILEFKSYYELNNPEYYNVI